MSELVKHLRTVHFIIIAACILVLIPKIGVRPGEVVTAHNQLKSIIGIRNSWHLWTKQFALEQIAWIKKLEVHWFKSEPEHGYIPPAELERANIRHSPNQGFQLRLNGAPIYFFLNVGPRGSTRRFLLAKPYGKLDVSDTFPTDISFPADDSGSQPFRTLQEFRYIWDATQQPMVSFIVSVSPVTYLVAGNSIIAQLKTTQDVKPGGGLELTSRSLGGCTEEGINIVVSSRASKDFNEVFCRKIEEGIIVFPAKKREPRLPSNLQQWLIQQFSIDGFSGGFTETFPELDRVTKVYQELEIGKISAILEAELQRSGERIQFLGLQLPERIIVNWGMRILICLQVYFCVQLWNFLRMSKTNFDEQSRNTGWIGLYREFWARLFSFLTIGLLPLATAILVSLESWEAFSISSAVAVMYTSPIVILVGLAGLLAAFLTFMLSRSEARHYIPDELGS